MFGSYYKVTEDFRPGLSGGVTQKDHEPFLSVEKGDIIFDVKILDAKWASGKGMLSQNLGKIPRNCIEKLESDEKPEQAVEGKSEDQNEKQAPANWSRTSVNSPTNREGGNLSPSSSTSRGSLRAVKPPHPPPKPRISQEMKVKGDIKLKTSDEGYNSSSHSSGEKSYSEILGDENSTEESAVPLITFRERTNNTSPCSSNHRPSIQDEDGYEIPMAISPRSSMGGVVATDKSEGVTLKFINKRKSLPFNDKEIDGSRIRSPSSPGSPDRRLESVNEIWTPTPTKLPSKGSYSPEHNEKKAIDRIRILIYFLISLCLSLGFFFLLKIFAGLSILLSLSITVSVFTMLFGGPLTCGHRRFFCIVALIAPSLFSKKAKICLCITLVVLIVTGPVCNISRNTIAALSYRNSDVSTVPSRANTTSKRYITTTTAEPTINFAKQKQVVMETTQSTFTHKTKVRNNTNEFLKICKNQFKTFRMTCDRLFNDTCQSRYPYADADTSKLCQAVTKLCPSSSSVELTCDSLHAKNSSKPEAISTASISVVTTVKIVLLELLPLLFLILLHEAYIYNRDYLSNKEADNVYITGKLKVLDCERRNRCLREKLFPLRKLEFHRYILPSSFHLTAKERNQVIKWIIVWIIVGFLILFSLLLDHYVFEAFQVLEGQDQSHLIRFTSTDTDLKNSMFIVFSLLLASITLQSYALRARSRICSSFFPKRESIRGMYLYYKILNERSRFWKSCREKIRHRAEARRCRWNIGVGHRICCALPKLLEKIVRKCFVYRCMICSSLSWRKSYVCKNLECYATFCFECYIDMGESCISCNPSCRQSVYL